MTAGDLPTVLNEVAALPEPAQAPLADWVAAAQAREAALAAADTLTTDLTTN